MSDFLYGSICLSDIPRELFKKVQTKNGEKVYLNIGVGERKEPQTFTDGGVERTYTHYVTCAPPKEERREGVNYFCGDLRSYKTTATAPVTAEAVTAAPAAADMDLPF
jgi:hypothetical protein